MASSSAITTRVGTGCCLRAGRDQGRSPLNHPARAPGPAAPVAGSVPRSPPVAAALGPAGRGRRRTACARRRTARSRPPRAPPRRSSSTSGTVVSASSLLSALSRTLAAMSFTDAGVWVNVFSKIVIGSRRQLLQVGDGRPRTPATCVYRLSSAVRAAPGSGPATPPSVCLTSRTSHDAAGAGLGRVAAAMPLNWYTSFTGCWARATIVSRSGVGQRRQQGGEQLRDVDAGRGQERAELVERELARQRRRQRRVERGQVGLARRLEPVVGDEVVDRQALDRSRRVGRVRVGVVGGRLLVRVDRVS